MFKIRGADGREYGPVTMEQLHQWIREGRAGGQTQVQAVGAATWSPLSGLPEFAEQFAAPPPVVAGAIGSMPPVVNTIAYGLFIMVAVDVLLMLASVFTLWRYARNGSFHPGFLYYFGWGVGVVSLPVQIITGMGLLRGREWARRLAVGCAVVLAIYGAWGMVKSAMMISATSDASYMLRSPMFLFSHAWSLFRFAFNIATVVFLLRKDVRAAFSRKTPAAA